MSWNCSLGIQKLISPKPSCFPLWIIHCNETDFVDRWMKSSSACIFFYGASKGNTGTTRAGVLLIFPDQYIETCFSWGLGIMSNNQEESYSLLKACQMTKKLGFKSIQIFGDSKLLIKFLNTNGHFNNSTLNLILQRI